MMMGSRLALMSMLVAAALAACDRRQPEAPKQPEKVAKAPTPTTPTAKPLSAERTIADLSGVWRVTGVETIEGDVSVFAKNDPAILGSEMTVDTARISWTHKASADFTADDVCEGPKPGLVPDEAKIAEIAARFAPALKRLGVEGPIGRPHEWYCMTGGEWGPGADNGAYLVPVGANHMVMSWYDNTALLLERKRP